MCGFALKESGPLWEANEDCEKDDKCRHGVVCRHTYKGSLPCRKTAATSFMWRDEEELNTTVMLRHSILSSIQAKLNPLDIATAQYHQQFKNLSVLVPQHT